MRESRVSEQCRSKRYRPARTAQRLAALLLLTACGEPAEPLELPAIDWSPERYICFRTDERITIDGLPNEAVWGRAPWTREFVDIEGETRPRPRFLTRASMVWDDDYFYIAAEMEEPHVWATLTERDSVIFHDNDFELFVDPDGDTHDYYELEINALGTEWDLLLTKPYRDDGLAENDWDIDGLRTAVHVDGTLNDPRDEDRGWSVEIALPWTALGQYAHRAAPPASGDQWRVNFSRVEWRTDVRGDKYVKRMDAASGEPLPEDNWVWSPQGLIAMHYPEMWGYVQFSGRVAGNDAEAFVEHPEEAAKWALRLLYYAQDHWRVEHGRYTDDVTLLNLPGPETDDFDWPPSIVLNGDGYTASVTAADGTTAHIREDGRVW
jgi:hypothetical protein